MALYTQTHYELGEVVFSTGFHESITGEWVPAGAEGRITSVNPYAVTFEVLGREIGFLRSDISRSKNMALSTHYSGRENGRYIL